MKYKNRAEDTALAINYNDENNIQTKERAVRIIENFMSSFLVNL